MLFFCFNFETKTMERDIQEKILSELNLIKGLLIGTDYQPNGLVQRMNCAEDNISKHNKFEVA